MTCEIVGVESIEGKTLADVFRGDDLAVVREHLESRFSRRAADEYEVDAIRQADGSGTRVHCRAMLDTNELGEVVGAIAVVREVLAENVSANVHKALEELREGREILRAVARECGRIATSRIGRNSASLSCR